MKGRYQRLIEDRDLNEYAQQLFDFHFEKICELGKSILRYKKLEAIPIDENLMKVFEMQDTKYYR